MNTRRFALSIVAVFIFVFLFEFLLHGLLLTDLYRQTAQLWRPQEEAKMIFIFLSQFGFAVVATYMFTAHFENRGIGEGLRFGLYVGLLLATIEIGRYCYMPIPGLLATVWVAGALIKGLGSGAVLALTYKR